MKETYESLINDIAEIAGYLWDKGWAERNAGNISVNITEFIPPSLSDKPALSPQIKLSKAFPALSNQYLFVTGTGKRMRDLARKPFDNASIIRINADGDAYETIAEQPIVPTSELPAHLSIHSWLKECRPDYKVVLHTHPTDLIALSQTNRYKDEATLNNLLWGMHPETLIVLPKGVGIVPYEVPGTMEIADLTLRALKSHDVVIWEKHGCLAIGENMIDAFDMIDTLSKSAQIFFYCKTAGLDPEGLTQNNFRDLIQAFKLEIEYP
ncbi:Rhamnulose-1-phosphate aldolase [termite gut metagenome]|uniref:Rhamnulose-1-phosphate aldolase n=1 Tax=termite gut metagenome TaxID=433724 RepID=A0A5J4SKP7_9ZZZZ